MEKKRSVSLLLSVGLNLLSSLGRAQVTPCEGIFDCKICLANSNQCVFAAGSCWDTCTEPENGATCYSSETFPGNLSSMEICELYNADNAGCIAQKVCSDCISTNKSDGNACQWYEEPKACFGGGTGPFGPGAMSCPTSAPAGTPEPQTTTPRTPLPTANTSTGAPTSAPVAPTLAPSQNETISPIQIVTIACEVEKDCQGCVGANCSWFPMGVCANGCDAIADTECYSTATFPNLDAEGICQTFSAVDKDKELCFAQLQCATCTATTKSDGTQCEWYDDTMSNIQWCQTGGCDQNGICGSSSCAAVGVNENDIPQNATTGLAETNGTSATGNVPDCREIDVYGVNGCMPCVSNNCAWSPAGCIDSCKVIADAPCFSSESFPASTPDEICIQAFSVGQEDEALCGSKNYCFTCTSTVKSDGVSTCSWYVDADAGGEWCGVGGCTAEGICGESNETVCQASIVPVEPETEESTPTEPTVVNQASGTITRTYLSSMGVMAVSLLLLLLLM